MENSSISNLIRDLKQHNALLRGSFTLRSGETSNIYFDKFIAESQPTILRQVSHLLTTLLPAGTKNLVGVELGGVPLVTAVSLYSNLPATFFRKKLSRNGKWFEGVEPKEDYVIIEDVVTMGGTILGVVEQLQTLGYPKPTKIISLLDREQGGSENIQQAGIEYQSLLTLSSLTTE